MTMQAVRKIDTVRRGHERRVLRFLTWGRWISEHLLACSATNAEIRLGSRVKKLVKQSLRVCEETIA